MIKSEKQFPDLIANLITRCNKALLEGDKIPVMGLILDVENKIETFLSVSDENNLTEELNVIQSSLKEKTFDQKMEACCIAYPDYEEGIVVVYLENRENYCAKYLIPVNTEPNLTLDLEKIQEQNGMIYVFPNYEDN